MENGRRLKAINYALIYAYVVAHLFIIYFVLMQVPMPDEGGLKNLGSILGGGSVASVFVVILVEAVSRDFKARLVAMRWKDAMPGCRAFTVHIHEDSRINTVVLGKRYGPLPSTAREQNALWYKLLKLNGDQEEVLHSHGRWLLLRDLTWVSLVLLVIAGLASIRAPAPFHVMSLLLIALAMEFLLLRLMAKHASHDLVKTVLAIESAREVAQ